MMCYRDISFCSDADVCQNKNQCDRWFSPAEEAKAVRWWGSDNVPVARMSFKQTCKLFKADFK